ncbi:hypothetical protein [Marinomonas spartinae]|uniref:hypothetical protein n=1 Tax=Marinomonas spartinae TaxID=1792290 RepID=UPI0018F1BF18|nr:hypothetical protein [Marinomonas spartinae]MBJ7556759.1 hypothetical protein [Marinomonas spartinae]
MQEPATKRVLQKRQNRVSEQISFRHSESVKTKLMELSLEENLGIAEIARQIFNEGLKARYGVIVRGNQIIE